MRCDRAGCVTTTRRRHSANCSRVLISYDNRRMAKLTVKQIQELAKSIIASYPGGIRYTDLAREILRRNPETNENTIKGTLALLFKKFPNELTKPSRGLFMLARGTDTSSVASAKEATTPTAAGGRVAESDFYQPFAEWLKNELEEVTDVVPLGGGGLKGKWGTPDVVGTYKSSRGDVIDFPVEIVSVEIKVDPQEPVVAFGQAIAYRLFSTKTYIAMPTTLTEEDKSRLGAC